MSMLGCGGHRVNTGTNSDVIRLVQQHILDIYYVCIDQMDCDHATHWLIRCLSLARQW